MQLEAKNVSFRYSKKTPWILKNVNFDVQSSERVALMGTSGCGKSTLSKILAGYLKPTEGEVLLDGKPLPERIYSPVQMIHQHPEQAVNPRWKMSKVLNECWVPDDKILAAMGIEKEWLKRWPSELSGGELQRFCVVRVLGNKSKILLCDEITTMLDAITQAQMWDIILKKSKEKNLGLVIITHNTALADQICTRKVSLQDISHQL